MKATIQKHYRWRVTIDKSHEHVQWAYDPKFHPALTAGFARIYSKHGFAVDPLPAVQSNVYACTLSHPSPHAMIRFLLTETVPEDHVIEELP